MQQKITPEPSQNTKWKGYGCYYCGEPGHWRRTCPQKPYRKRKPPDPGGGTAPPTSDTYDSNDPEERVQSAPSPKKRQIRKVKTDSQPQYCNPDPVARMFGRANEAPVEVIGVPTTGATVTIVNAEYCEQLGLEIHFIDSLISVSVTGGTNIPYLGYSVATLEFPHIPNYSEEVVMLLIPDSTDYTRRVPLQIGIRVITVVIETLTPEDLKHLDETWKQTYVGTLKSCAAQQKKDKGDSLD